MNSLAITSLLHKTARLYQEQQESFSKTEINKGIEEVKYLSKHKSVPHLTIEKKIVNLENKLKVVLTLQQKLEDQRKRERTKVISLKRKMANLKRQLDLSKNANLHKKVDKLSFLLGEKLAKEGTEKDVSLAQMPMINKIARLRKLNQKLTYLKQELKTKSEDKTKELRASIELIEEQLKPYLEKYPRLFKTPPMDELPVSLLDEKRPRHTFMMHPSLDQGVDIGATEHLPIPPPPKTKKE
ncbi:MAG TPA: hypothetical protein VJC39_00890 [Candidatus Nanoarchaeia archaeon]|nr:hypothetical protein [Candidatus Nanoarchaeia archaeon]